MNMVEAKTTTDSTRTTNAAIFIALFLVSKEEIAEAHRDTSEEIIVKTSPIPIESIAIPLDDGSLAMLE